jgi:hypothetical protein
MSDPASMPPAAKTSTNSGVKRWAFTLTAVVLVVVAIAAVAGAGAKKVGAGSSGRPTPLQSSPPTSPSTPSTVPAGTTPAGTPAPTPTPVAEPASHAYRGHGDTLLRVTKPGDGPALVTIAGHGSAGNFAVTSLDSSLQEIDLLVNVIGAYSGTRLIDAQDGQHTARLRIEYGGSWTVVVRPVAAAPQLSTTAMGEGDAVLLYLGAAQGVSITNRGSSNFAVTSYGDNGDLLVNEIGSYSGQVAVGAGPELIQVESDGQWTMKLTG